MNKEIEIRNKNRIKNDRRLNNEEEDDDDLFFLDLCQKNIIIIEDEQEIPKTLDLLFSKDEDVVSSTLDSLVYMSNYFPGNLLQNLTPSHFDVLYGFLDNNKTMGLIIFIFSNLSKKMVFNPPFEIFEIISNILSNANIDDANVESALVLTKNLIQSKETYYSYSIHYNIHQVIIENNSITLHIIEKKIATLSAFLKYENHDTEEYILNYITQDVFTRSDETCVYREIIIGFEYAMCWSEQAIQIINESDIISISIELLFSDYTKNVKSSLSFLKKCIENINIADIQFVNFFILLMTEDEDDDIYCNIIASFVCLIKLRSSFRAFLFQSLCEFGLEALMSNKSYPIKKSFLSFLNQSAQICPEELMIVPPDELSFFLLEMIQTGEEIIQYSSLEIICSLINSVADIGDAYSEWIENFSQSLISLNIIDDIYQSSMFNNNQNISDNIDLLVSFLCGSDDQENE